MGEHDNLLCEYYSHLQHTEKQRSTFFQIFLTITGAGVIGFEISRVPTEIKLFLSVLMVPITWYGLDLMRKSGQVVDTYTRCVIDILSDDYPKYCINRHLSPVPRYSKSKTYVSIFEAFLLFYIFLTVYYLERICFVLRSLLVYFLDFCFLFLQFFHYLLSFC